MNTPRKIDERFVRDLLLEALTRAGAPFALLEAVHTAAPHVRPALSEALCRMRFLRRYEAFAPVLADAVYGMTGDAELAERARVRYQQEVAL